MTPPDGPQFHALHAPTPYSVEEVTWWPGGPVRPVVPTHRGGGELEWTYARQYLAVPIPPHPPGILGWRVRRRCRAEGGHWWHPADVMIAWFCCNCGAQRDGSPRDGT